MPGRSILGLVALTLVLGCRASMPESSAWAAGRADAGAVQRQAIAAAADAGAGGCKSDADCTLTRVPEGGCCESLCQPRAVAKSELSGQKCPTQCPEPLCRQPRFSYSAVCHAGRCDVQAAPVSND